MTWQDQGYVIINLVGEEIQNLLDYGTDGLAMGNHSLTIAGFYDMLRTKHLELVSGKTYRATEKLNKALHEKLEFGGKFYENTGKTTIWHYKKEQ